MYIKSHSGWRNSCPQPSICILEEFSDKYSSVANVDYWLVSVSQYVYQGLKPAL